LPNPIGRSLRLRERDGFNPKIFFMRQCGGEGIKKVYVINFECLDHENLVKFVLRILGADWGPNFISIIGGI
jgi:hypothetical protein